MKTKTALVAVIAALKMSSASAGNIGTLGGYEGNSESRLGQSVIGHVIQGDSVASSKTRGNIGTNSIVDGGNNGTVDKGVEGGLTPHELQGIGKINPKSRVALHSYDSDLRTSITFEGQITSVSIGATALSLWSLAMDGEKTESQLHCMISFRDAEELNFLLSALTSETAFTFSCIQFYRSSAGESEPIGSAPNKFLFASKPDPMQPAKSFYQIGWSAGSSGNARKPLGGDANKKTGGSESNVDGTIGSKKGQGGIG